MAGTIRLFEKTEDGRLVEVAPADAGNARKGRSVSRVALTIDVLWTAEEEAARDAETAASAEQASERARAAEAKAQRRAEIAGRIGLTTAELDALFA